MSKWSGITVIICSTRERHDGSRKGCRPHVAMNSTWIQPRGPECVLQYLLAMRSAEQWAVMPALLDLADARKVQLLERHRNMLLKASAEAGHMDL